MLPTDIPGGAPDATLQQAAVFAWQEFIALNWPTTPWLNLDEITQSGPGAQVINATYTVPAFSTNLVVRAVYTDSTAAAESCKAGNGSDMDDLMLAVQ